MAIEVKFRFNLYRGKKKCLNLKCFHSNIFVDNNEKK